jgi:predicted enzyme related to lactoylglutathione lyase
MGTTVYGELGAFGWNELVTADLHRARPFYEDLFGWSAESVPMPNVGYLLLKHGGEDVAGMMEMPKDAAPDSPYWCVYFVVADADIVFRRSVALGARVAVPLMDVPTVGRFGLLTDPQGALFAVIRLEPRAA